MRSRFSADPPLALYSVWYLLILMSFIFLNHLDRVVHDLIRDADPNVFAVFAVALAVSLLTPQWRAGCWWR